MLLNTQDIKLKYFVYVRKSSEGEERQALSIDSQKEKILEYFSQLDIVEVLEERHSAFKPNQRQVFNSMLNRIRAGEANGIIAWHPDRLSRNEVDAANLTYMIREMFIYDLKFCNYNFDNSPECIWMLQMALSQSQYESAKKGRDVKRGLEKKVKLGWLPGVAPIGYINDRTREKGDRRILSDPERFSLIKKMWQLMLTGNYSVAKIHRIANEQWGFRTIKRKKVGNKPVALSTVHRMFTNPFYAGVIVFDGQESQGKHKPMITLDEFEKVQYFLGDRGRPRPKKHNLPYAGVFKCEECGCSVVGEVKRKYIKSQDKIKFYIYYHCTRKRRDYKCSQKSSIDEAQLTEQMEELMKSLTILPDFKKWALEALNSQNDREVEERQRIYEMKHKSLEDAQKRLDNLVQMRLRELIDDEEFKVEKQKLQKEIDGLRLDVNETEKRAKTWLKLTEDTFELAVHGLVNFRKADPQTKKEIFLAFGSNPTIKDKKVCLDIHDCFKPIQNHYPALEKIYVQARTKEMPLPKVKALVSKSWLHDPALVILLDYKYWAGVREQLNQIKNLRGDGAAASPVREAA